MMGISTSRDFALLSSHSRTGRRAFTEGIVNDDVISDQDIQSFLSTRCRNLHRHDIALRLSRAVRVCVDPLFVSFAHSALRVWLTKERFELRRSRLTLL